VVAVPDFAQLCPDARMMMPGRWWDVVAGPDLQRVVSRQVCGRCMCWTCTVVCCMERDDGGTYALVRCHSAAPDLHSHGTWMMSGCLNVVSVLHFLSYMYDRHVAVPRDRACRAVAAASCPSNDLWSKGGPLADRLGQMMVCAVGNGLA
jgi:hypothetical protein